MFRKLLNVHRSSVSAYGTTIRSFENDIVLKRIQLVSSTDDIVDAHKVVGAPGIDEPELDRVF
eukprot:4534723-Heterocapsa_arctica.AAC.1